MVVAVAAAVAAAVAGSASGITGGTCIFKKYFLKNVKNIR